MAQGDGGTAADVRGAAGVGTGAAAACEPLLQRRFIIRNLQKDPSFCSNGWMSVYPAKTGGSVCIAREGVSRIDDDCDVSHVITSYSIHYTKLYEAGALTIPSYEQGVARLLG